MTTQALDRVADELLTTDELATRTKISKRTWEGRRRKGGDHTPPFIKLGTGNSARVLYRWPVVLEWLDRQTRQSTTSD